MARKPPQGKSLAELNPELAKEWHPSKNGDLSPYDVSCGSNHKAWWKCNKGVDHEWDAAVKSRNKGFGCPICYGRRASRSTSLGVNFPNIASYWHPSKNNLTPFEVTPSSNKKVWWKCDKGDDHEWIRTVRDQKKFKNCPVCSGKKTVFNNSFLALYPKLASEWHPTKNGNLKPQNFAPKSNKKVWWKCDKGDDHEWITTIDHRTRGRGCPICFNKKIVKSNCLATTHPKLAKEWHPTKNGNLTPNDVSFGYGKFVWWNCDKGDDHEWKSTVNTRSNQNTGCTICSGNKVVLSNCLATLKPKLASEWHPTKNGKLTPYDFTLRSHHKAWWKCDKGVDHEWITTIDKRSLGRSCPFCTLTPQSKQELTITFELLKIFKDINPKGFKTRVDGKLWTIDIYIPQLHLGIEFDGNYWHKNKQALDKLKTEQLNDEGFRVIRVREEPLKKLFETDVISNQPFNGKDVTDKVLKQIMSMFELSASRISKIDSYLAKKNLQNEKGLEDYIEMILTGKAEK